MYIVVSAEVRCHSFFSLTTLERIYAPTFPPDRVAQRLMLDENMQNIIVLCVILALMEVVLAVLFGCCGGSFWRCAGS